MTARSVRAWPVVARRVATVRRDSGSSRRAAISVRRQVQLTAGAGLGITAAVALFPPLSFAYRNPRLHLVLVTSEALIALLVAFLALGRARRRQRAEDMLLCCGLAGFAASNLVFAAAPSVFAGEARIFSTWTALISFLLAGAALAAAAIVPPRRVRIDRRLAWTIAGLLIATLAAIALTVVALGDVLPVAVRRGVAPGSHGLHIRASPAVAACDAAGGLLLALAAAGFARRADARGDRLLAGLAIGCAWGAIARLNYLFFPSVFTRWVSTGDVFRLLFYISILAAAGSEIEAHARSAAEAAALRERKRIACDLHDGLAQELASIQRNLRWLEADDAHVQRALAATRRALAHARGAIGALGDSPDRSLAEALEAVIRIVAEREGVIVSLNFERDAAADPAQREALACIASEAITNAARHGHAEVVHVEVAGHPRVRLRVTDGGGGFDAERRRGSGFGLIDMRERAAGVGGRLRVRSQPGAGTSVELVL